MNLHKIPNEFNPGITAPNYFIRKLLLTEITRLSPTLSGKLMDFGCGAKPYKSLFNVNEYIGVDYNGEGHLHDTEEIEVYYDGKKLPFPENTFDAIFTTEVFEHIFNLEEIIKELFRTLKPGGKILLTCPFSICEHEIPADFARYTSFGLKDLMERNGFKIIEQIKTGNNVITIFQMWNLYLHQHIAPFFKNIPVVRSIFRTFTYTFVNVCSLIFNKLFPKRNDLYLNNIILAQKP